jgi:hypothetical protein
VEDMTGEWQRKGKTLSDKTAQEEFGLTQEEIIQAIRKGQLQYRMNSIYGNPFLRRLLSIKLCLRDDSSGFLKSRLK